MLQAPNLHFSDAVVKPNYNVFKMIFTTEVTNSGLKGHCHGILASFYNAKICSCINGNPKIMMQFCYLGRYHYTETIYCCLSLRMARMEMD